MKIPLTQFAPHTLRLKSDAGGEFLMAGHDEGFVGEAREVYASHHAVVGDAGFSAFVAHLPSAELFIGPLPASAIHFQETGGSKADQLVGGDLSDTLLGGAGNDTRIFLARGLPID